MDTTKSITENCEYPCAICIILSFAVFLLLAGCQSNPDIDNRNNNPGSGKTKWDTDATTTVPTLKITTVNGNFPDNTTDYIAGTYSLDGKNIYKNHSGKMRVKGHGHYSWGFSPKKPLRLNLDKGEALLGMGEDKDWILLANYFDPTLMLNAIAMKIGRQLEMPYTNHMVPVNLVVNGEYAGSYILTERVEVDEYRVNIDDNGQLFELDQYFDGTAQFYSPYFGLPVIIHYPELTADDTGKIHEIEQDFSRMEELVFDASFPDNGYKNYIDMESVAQFFIVSFLTDNEELNHPKSVYMYRKSDGKYYMGPLWDFDWAYGFEVYQQYFVSATVSPFWTTHPESGTNFFIRFLQDPELVSLIKSEWKNYKSKKLSELLLFIDKYNTNINASRTSDNRKWQVNYESYPALISRLKYWINARADYIDAYLSSLKSSDHQVHQSEYSYR